MKAIVLFDTLFGNTEKIAHSLGKGLQDAGVEARGVNLHRVSVDELAAYDLLVFGAPTQYFTASKSLKEFLERIHSANLKGKLAFAFDTKLGSRLSGSAAKYIEKELIKQGFQIVAPRESAVVTSIKDNGSVGAAKLREGEEEHFREIGRRLGSTILRKGGQEQFIGKDHTAETGT